MVFVLNTKMHRKVNAVTDPSMITIRVDGTPAILRYSARLVAVRIHSIVPRKRVS